MNERRKPNTQQYIILAVLAAVLIFVVFKVLLPQMNATKERESRRAERRAGSGESTNSNGVTEMPVVPTTSGSGSKKALARAESEYRLNPNQFRVFQINPPKNPFAQKEAWYAETLKELPGYPQLRENDYFESSLPYLPATPEVMDPARDWRKVVIERNRGTNNMEITGRSTDGTIQTSVSLNEGTASNDHIEWTPGLGIPLSALTEPGWETRYPTEALIARGLIDDPNKEEEEADRKAMERAGLANSSDLFVGDDYSGLGLPGGSGPDGALRGGQPQGDSIACTGVNHQGKRSSAIMVVNGKSYIVSEGSVLPTHYQVLEIKEDGVVVTDLKDGSSKWFEISSASRGQRNTKKSAEDAAAPAAEPEADDSDIVPADLPLFTR